MRHTTLKNVRVFAKNREGKSGFNIYLDFSGQREFLVAHRHSGLLYNLLKDGMRADDLRRWTPRRRTASCHRLEGMVSHLLAVVDDYAMEREMEYTESDSKAMNAQRQCRRNVFRILRHESLLFDPRVVY